MFHRPGAVGPGEEAGDLGDPVVAGDLATRPPALGSQGAAQSAGGHQRRA